MIFSAKTDEGYLFKILTELLQINIKSACFKITQDGIRLRDMDDPNCMKVLFDLKLNADMFLSYKFNSNKPINVGINLKHFHKMLKSMKKKDSIELFIEDETSENFGIRVIPKENNRVSTSFIRIHTLQVLDIDIPEGYTRPVIVPSTDFQKMVKDLRNISEKVNFSSYGEYISFQCLIDNVLSKEVKFGENICHNNKEAEIEEEFDINQLLSIVKLAGLNKNIQIYSKKGFPILLKTQVGSLGHMSVFVKTNALIDE